MNSDPAKHQLRSPPDAPSHTQHPNATPGNPGPVSGPPSISYLYSKLFDLAYKDKKPVFKKEVAGSQMEKDLFFRYNTPRPLREAKDWKPRHLRYVPQSPETSEESSATIYPIFRKDLGFKPKLDFFQSFTQNVYTDSLKILEEIDIHVRSLRRLSFQDMGLKDAQKAEEMQIFKLLMNSEAFRA